MGTNNKKHSRLNVNELDLLGLTLNRIEDPVNKNSKNYECIYGIEPHLHFQIGREFNASYLHNTDWGWRYSLYDIEKGINPHLYWANGKNNISCFYKNKKYKVGTITYPVPC